MNKNSLKESAWYWRLREWYSYGAIQFKRIFNRPVKKKPRILFYHVSGLGYGGTEAFLQIIAKYLNKQSFDVYYMYSDQLMDHTGLEDFTSRLKFILDGGVFPIRFDYSHIDNGVPYVIHGMSPDFFRVVKDFDIDIVVTAGSGHANFPFSALTNIPIILINVFGQPNMQSNIAYHLCISQEVADKLKPFVPREKIKVMYVPTEPPLAGSADRGTALRRYLGINDGDFVFGRIGRSSDDIFDPIGIRAFQKVVSRHSNAHYLIVSPPEILKKIVKEDHIPNVHYVNGSGKIDDLWAFYYAMDVLAHFRKDGESFGLNIAQAMLCGRPVISHKSRFWNAHLEYLTDDFSRVAEIDNIDQYEKYMEWFIAQWQQGQLGALGDAARKKAESIVLYHRHVADFEGYVSKILESRT